MKSLVFILVHLLCFSVILIKSEGSIELNGIHQLIFGQGIEKTFSYDSDDVKRINFDEELCQVQMTYFVNEAQNFSIWAVQSECNVS